MTRKPVPPAHKARAAIRDALAAYNDPSAKPLAELVKDTAVNVLVMDGMADDTAADLVERVWRDEFETMEAN